jgi:hypothetical protein
MLIDRPFVISRAVLIRFSVLAFAAHGGQCHGYQQQGHLHTAGPGLVRKKGG